MNAVVPAAVTQDEAGFPPVAQDVVTAAVAQDKLAPLLLRRRMYFLLPLPKM